MIKKFEVTKRQMIKAIATENLKPGRFFDDMNESIDTCPVCAVGSILRSMGLQNLDNEGFANKLLDGPNVANVYSIENIFNNNDNNFLSKLSCEFEYAFDRARDSRMSVKRSIDMARMHAVSVVEAIGPKSIEVHTKHTTVTRRYINGGKYQEKIVDVIYSKENY